MIKHILLNTNDFLLLTLSFVCYRRTQTHTTHILWKVYSYNFRLQISKVMYLVKQNKNRWNNYQKI